ncbi:hypothetical protein ACFQL1_15005 [Halomicroarcula sp. GCM10025709]
MVGIVLWSTSVAIGLVFAPADLAAWAVASDPLAVAGGIMVSIGLWSGLVHFAFVASTKFWTDHDQDLTEWG